jgi:hypothetical protein
LERKLVQEYKIEHETATKVIFLISLQSFRIEDVFDMYKKKQQCFIKDSSILEWLDVQNMNDNALIKFVEYRPSVSAKELMDKGIKGAELGREIKRLEMEKFKEILR